MEARGQSFVVALGPSEVGLGGGLDMGIGGEGGVGGGGLGAAPEAEFPSSSPSPSPTPSPPTLPQPPVHGAGGMEGIVRAPPPPPPSAGMMGRAMGMSIGMAPMGGSGGSDDLVLLGKKKRGRPRKYGPDGMALALSPNSASPSPFFVSSDSSGKRGKGRPAGSGKRQLLSALGDWFTYSAGGNFTPHVVTVATGEDVAAKILSFSQKGPRAICILSANGAISNVTLRQPGSCGGTLTYEGRFEILSLSGSFMVTDEGGMRSRTGGISVSLAGPDGRVVGGGIAGLLLAASPIQVVVGSFIANAFKEHKRKATVDGITSVIPPATGVLTVARPISQANPNGDCETPTSTLPAQVHGDADNSISNLNHNSSYSNRAVGWHGLHSSEHRPSPDINICLHGE